MKPFVPTRSHRFKAHRKKLSNSLFSLRHRPLWGTATTPAVAKGYQPAGFTIFHGVVQSCRKTILDLLDSMPDFGQLFTTNFSWLHQLSSLTHWRTPVSSASLRGDSARID